MHTKAVFRAAQGLADAGLATLRFNFRGVGLSTGTHDEGIGEREDALAALDWLADQHPGLPLVIGGFSFGSQVGMSVGAGDPRVVSLLGLGLPVDKRDYDFGFLAEIDKPVLVVQGEQDEFGSGGRVQEVLAPLGPHITLVRVPDTDHFFAERVDELRESVRSYYATGPGAAVLPTAP